MLFLTTILSLLGALITATSSVYGLRNKLYSEDSSGRRSLLTSGKISITFTVAGLLITLISGIIGYRTKQKEIFDKAFTEAQKQQNETLQRLEDIQRQKNLNDSLRFEQRISKDSIIISQQIQTQVVNSYSKFLINSASLDAQRREIQSTKRIILSGQPLTSMHFSWKFDFINKSLMQMLVRGDSIAIQEIMDYQQGGVRGLSQNGPSFRNYSLYPFIKSLIKNTSDNSDEPLLVLISLDNNQNCILPFGYLSSSAYSDSAELSACVETSTEMAERFIGNEITRYNFPIIKHANKTAHIYWDLNPLTFSNSINSQILGVKPSANLPDTVKIAILHNFDYLPFSSANFASCPNYTVWDFDADVEPMEPIDTLNVRTDVLKKSFLCLIPNNLAEQQSIYTFSRYFVQYVSEKETAEAIPCLVAVIYFVKQR